MSKYIEKLLVIGLYITCIVLPTHWFLVSRPEWSYWQGSFIDYWAPKLFISQLCIWVLWGITAAKTIATRYEPRQSIEIRQLRWPNRQVFAVAVLMMMSLTATQLQSTVPIVGLVWMSQLVSGPLLFWLWWRHESLPAYHLRLALGVSATVQAFLAAYQWIFQSSLGGYWLLGQPTFAPYSFLAESTWLDTVRYLPYGSTPHPNVLAAWLVTGLFAFWIAVPQQLQISNVFRTLRWGLAIFLSTALLLTESWAGFLSLIMMSGTVILMRPDAARLRYRWKLGVWLGMWMIAVPGLILLSPSVIRVIDTRNFVAPESWSRRQIMIANTPDMVRHFPLGAGLQQSWLAYSPQTRAQLGNFSRQPIHNTPINMVIDIGISTIIVFFVFLYFVQKKYSLINALILVSMPYFSLDHFGYSTMSGQFLTLCILIILKDSICNNRPNN